MPEQFPPRDVEVLRYQSAHEHCCEKREIKVFLYSPTAPG